jgi:hypothetical protein
LALIFSTASMAACFALVPSAAANPVSGAKKPILIVPFANAELPMQRAKEKTIISTDFGDGGNAHSEYLGPLAEMGVLGSLSFIIIAIIILSTGIRVYKRIENPSDKHMVMGILIAFVTYFIHGLMNNFLDTDKASVPFWGFAAILVLLDIQYFPKSEDTTQKKITR